MDIDWKYEGVKFSTVPILRAFPLFQLVMGYHSSSDYIFSNFHGAIDSNYLQTNVTR
jgi:hypothetical protein